MRAIKTTTISILAVSLLAGSAVGVTAQDEEAADPMAPATFEVGFAGPPEVELESTTTETEYGESVRGDGIVNIPFDAGDSRASGLYTQVGNEEFLGNLMASSGRVRIVNDDGAWEGTSNGFLRMLEEPTEGPPFDRAASIGILTGSDAYEGLTLILTQTMDQFQGYIIPTELLPPVPDLPAQ